MIPVIESITALEILDSRGHPTVRGVIPARQSYLAE